MGTILVSITLFESCDWIVKMWHANEVRPLMPFNKEPRMKQPLKLTTRWWSRANGLRRGGLAHFAKQATAVSRRACGLDPQPKLVAERMPAHRSRSQAHRPAGVRPEVQMPEAPNIAREIVLGTGLAVSVSTDAYSVSRACATSFQAVANVTESIRVEGRHVSTSPSPAVPAPLPYRLASGSATLQPAPAAMVDGSQQGAQPSAAFQYSAIVCV